MIAIKYAFMSEEQIELIENVTLNSDLWDFNILFEAHRDLSLENLYRRINIVLKKIEIDQDSFFFEVPTSHLLEFPRLKGRTDMENFYK